MQGWSSSPLIFLSLFLGTCYLLNSPCTAILAYASQEGSEIDLGTTVF